MDYQLIKKGNNLHVNITRGGFVGYIQVDRVDLGGSIKGIYINRPRGGDGGPVVVNMAKTRYKVCFPNNHKTFDNRATSPNPAPPPKPTGYSLLNFIYSIPRLTSGYGWRTVFGVRSFHRGQDYAGPPNRMQALFFSRKNVKGTLYRYYEANGFGRYVYIKCDDGFGIVYAHLDAYGAASGSRVDANTVVGYCGASGRVTGPHVHVELHKKFGAGFTQHNAVPFVINPR